MSNKMITKAISAVIALGMSSTALAESQPQYDMSKMMGNIEGMEKCYGVAKANRNDCGTTSHSCAGESKIEREKSAWILVPNGTCDKIAGGNKTPEKV
jgi:uncharacterized membrane protein